MAGYNGLWNGDYDNPESENLTMQRFGDFRPALRVDDLHECVLALAAVVLLVVMTFSVWDEGNVRLRP